MRHLLGPVAWSLATPEGHIYKSVKSKLLIAIEERIETSDKIPSKSARIYDGMCIMHQLPKYLETFRGLPSHVLKTITSNDSNHVFFITDQYWKDSTKSCERNRRANTESILLTAASLEQKLPKQMKRYLSIDANREELIDFLLNDWNAHYQVILILIVIIYET